jgi:8-oxo-dGTP diphosphatase
MNFEADAKKTVPLTPAGSGILFVNSASEVLLLLRDDKPNIPFPNCWDIPGGMVEPGETPEQCVVREMREEIGVEVPTPNLFRVYQYPERVDHVFWLRRDLNIADIQLTEGQRLKWFSKNEIQDAPAEVFAFGFKRVILDFFQERPFAK